MNHLGYLMKLPNGQYGWHLFSYQRMLKSGKRIRSRIILVNEKTMLPKVSADGRSMYVQEWFFDDIKIIGHLTN